MRWTKSSTTVLGVGLLTTMAALTACSSTSRPGPVPVPSATATAAPTAVTGVPTAATGVPTTATGVSTSAPGPSTTPTPTPTSTASATTTPGTTPAPSATTPGSTPAPSASPTPSGAAVLRPGDEGAAVAGLQQELSDLGYWLGTPDGHYGELTRQAVYAVQKAAGLGRDGVTGPLTRAAIERGVRPVPRSTSGTLVEIDRDHQLLLLVTDGRLEHVLNTSTGTFEHYTYQGRTLLADTPAGRFTVTRQVDGWDRGPLGSLYRPKYFHPDGIAVHGFASVPPYPASHGCARVSIPAMDWLWQTGRLPVGRTVWVY